MDPNEQIKIARHYHQATKHSPISVQQNRHRMDWANVPTPYKIYPDLDPLPLPTGLSDTSIPALEAIAGTGRAIPSTVNLDINQVSYLLFYSGGITKKLIYQNQEIVFRAAPCAGALYPIEIYLVCGHLLGLDPGVYHYSPLEHCLRLIRPGDWRNAIIEATGAEISTQTAAASLLFSAITWRSAWKYQARAYRYHFWDCGVVLANTLASAHALGVKARVIAGFVDETVNRLAGLDGEREKAVCLLTLNEATHSEPAAGLDIDQLRLNNTQQNDRPVEYPIIDQLHKASALLAPEEVDTWRKPYRDPAESSTANRSGDRIPLPQPAGNSPVVTASASLEDVILRRGSSRRFQLESFRPEELAMILRTASRPFSGDWLSDSTPFLNRFFLTLHAVEGVRPGTYRYYPSLEELTLLKPGNFRGDSAYLCLGQELGGSSSFTVFLLANLDAILQQYGNRGYRIAQLEAGILGGRIYLGAYALGRGATGLTFFDDLVIGFFSPEAVGNEPIFVTSCGQPARPSRPAARMVRLQPGALRV